MTFAQRLWLDYTKGRESLEAVFNCLIRSQEEKEFERQIDSMPPEMFRAFSAYVAPTSIDAFGPQWEDIPIGSLEMHAFEFDLEKAHAWKKDRFKKFHLLCHQNPPLPSE